MIKKIWSERRDSNPRPLPPQSSEVEKDEQFQSSRARNVLASFLIDSYQSVAKLWRVTLPLTAGQIGAGVAC